MWLSVRQKIRSHSKTLLLVSALLIFSFLIPIIYDEQIETKNNRMAEISELVNINLLEFSRYHQIMQRHIDFKSTYNILLAFKNLNESIIPQDLILAYNSDKNDALIVAVKKIATLAGATDEEITNIDKLTYEKLIDIRIDYVDQFADKLNEGTSEIVSLQTKISNLKKQKYAVVSIGSIIQTFGIILSEKEKKTST